MNGSSNVDSLVRKTQEYYAKMRGIDKRNASLKPSEQKLAEAITEDMFFNLDTLQQSLSVSDECIAIIRDRSEVQKEGAAVFSAVSQLSAEDKHEYQCIMAGITSLE